MPRNAHKQNHKQPQAPGEVRIIGGQLRGRKLTVADVPGLRPSTDRVRETLFNWLQFELAGQRCLDLFGGSGALGFEALSRGAELVVMIEKDAKAAAILTQHATTLNQVSQGQVLLQQGDALQFLRQTPAAPFAVVFIDPPFRMGLAEQCCALLEQYQWLQAGSWVYLETEAEWHGQLPEHWRLHRSKAAGQVSYQLYQLEELA
jgi:16S rRNA (guanine966-N2)-methyltransferase